MPRSKGKQPGSPRTRSKTQESGSLQDTSLNTSDVKGQRKAGGQGSELLSNSMSSYRSRTSEDENSESESVHDDSQQDSQDDLSGNNEDVTDNLSHFSVHSSPNTSRESFYAESKRMLEEVQDKYRYEKVTDKHSFSYDRRDNEARSSSSSYSRPGIHQRNKTSSPAYTPYVTHSSPTQGTPRGKRSHLDKADGNTDVFECNFKAVCGICIVIVLVLLCVFLLMPGKAVMDESSSRNELSARDKMVNTFVNDFKLIMSQFPTQTEHMWKVLKASTKRVLKSENPEMPAVILMAANKQAFNTAKCLAFKFAEVAVKAYGTATPAVINKQMTALSNHGNSPEQLKEYLDTTLQAALRDEKVVVLEDIDLVPGQAAMIFHSYCDNEFAPFKDSVLIFTMLMDSKEELTYDNEIENYLESKWENDLDKDKRAALIYSRIANSIALVTAESEENYRKTCL